MTALIVILTLVTAGLILDLAARRSDRRTRAWVATMAAQARCDHDHAAAHAAMPLATLLPGPSDTPVHDRCAAIFGVVPEVRNG